MAQNAPVGLTAAQWACVEALFPDLLALPIEKRAAFLDRHCAADAPVRAELESLLAAASELSPLDHALLVAATTTPVAAVSLPEGERLGAWRVVRLLGRGGMGEVYLAQRAEGGFAQTCAIKRLRGDAVEHAARFEIERGILARLDHPNIARLLDGGIGADGRAWMAMEYVIGDNLVEYCRAHALGINARMALFDQVCEAVAYAHTHLIVHRDLKPANIMVTAEVQVKLLDFGIAKLLDLGAETQTQTASLLTPEHAAPEQFDGGQITTAVDVYALGVLLYELLSGKRPWATGATPVSTMVDRLTRGEPLSPSRAGAASPPLSPTLLRGDLDAIVRRCLRREPRDRYATVEALREDMRRWREHQPVSARRGAAGYALQRWLRRHRLGVAAAAMVLIALLIGLGAALWQARRAQDQAWRAERVKQLVLAAFRESDPLSRPGSNVRTPAQLIADGVAIADRQLIDEPDLHAELLDDFGEIQTSLGDFPGAHDTLQRALAQRRALHQGDDMDVAETLRKLASVYSQEGEQQRALDTAEEAQRMLVRLGQSASVEAARAKLIIAMVLINRDQREHALQLIVEAQHTFEATLGRNDTETALAVFHRAQALDQLRRDGEAVAIARDAIARIQVSLGSDSPRLIPMLTALGIILARSHPEEAVATYQRSADLARHYLGARHIELASVLDRQAHVLADMGRTDRAEIVFTQAFAALPQDADGERGQLLVNRGKLYMQLHRYADAERDLHQGFSLRRQNLGDGAGITWYTASLWGSALRELGKPDQAEQVQRDALARLQKILGAGAYQNTLLMDELAETLGARGKHVEAIDLARRSLALTGKIYPPTHPLIAERTLRLAKALRQDNVAASKVEAITRCDQAAGLYRAIDPHKPEYIQAAATCKALRTSAQRAG